jgi:predicted ATP-grasp superfamily ATP-dependent carboligase
LAVLLPAGEQVVECQSGRFRYLGGSLPAAGSVQEAAGEMLRKLAAAMPDFRGWLGVDFVCEVDGEPRIVEINPRLCTSYVGYRQLARFSLAGEMSGEIAVDDLGLAWRAERVDFRV